MVIIEGKAYEKGIHNIDGQRVQVIDKNTWKVIGPAPEPVAAPAAEDQAEDERINVNEADAETLEALEGVGKAAAKRIVAGRPFETVDDLVRVRGVSERTVELNRERITA